MIHCADMSAHTRTILSWLAALAWAGVIFGLSSQPGSKLPGGWSVEGHLGVYAVLGVLVWFALGGRSAGLRGIILAIAIASAYGITDEFHQSFVPQRTPDVLDWVTDTAGAAVGVMTVAYLSGRRAGRTTSSPTGAEMPGSDDAPAAGAD
jgi:VanZ family protein